jgi:hypothetical protein
MDELRRGDPEAAELLGSVSVPDTSRGPRPEQRMYRWRDYQDSMRHHDDSMRQYQDALRDYLKRFRGEFDRRMPSPPQPPTWREPGEPALPGPGGPPLPPEVPPAQPEARFEVQPDGKITVHVQDGPTQITMTFPDEKAFQDKAPQLYERYRETLQRVR